MSTPVADNTQTEKPEFSEAVQALINEGKIVVTDDEVKIGADASPSGEELKGTYKKLSGGVAEALTYLEGSADRLAAYVWDKINTVRKNSARQSLYNDAIPSEDKAFLSMARKAVKGGVPGFAGLSDTEAVAKIKGALGLA